MIVSLLHIVWYCKFCEESQRKFLAAPGVRIRKPTRVPKITPSEIITILLIYQRSHYIEIFIGTFESNIDSQIYQHMSVLMSSSNISDDAFSEGTANQGPYRRSTKINTKAIKTQLLKKQLLDTRRWDTSMVLSCTLL